ncbi:MAG TPA: hypothetical protein VF575_00655 [Candidatus Saccharimonadales bacterium]|jgi:hypothetical protein
MIFNGKAGTIIDRKVEGFFVAQDNALIETARMQAAANAGITAVAAEVGTPQEVQAVFTLDPTARLAPNAAEVNAA